MARRRTSNMEGIVPVIKPPGITSHDVVGLARRFLGERRIGHSGTLDPLAMGVLPLYVGRATRLIEYADHTKRYVAECCMEYATDTEDSTGQIVARRDETAYTPPSRLAWEQVLQTFRGVSTQRPSSYSALKVEGRRAYDWAREGREVVLPERPIEIMDIQLLAYAYPYVTFSVTCSGGTYIRALIRDIAAQLGTYATMTALTRTDVGNLSLVDCVTLEELESKVYKVLSPTFVLGHIPSIEATPSLLRNLLQGRRVPTTVGVDGIYRLEDDSQFYGMVAVEHSLVKAKKMLYTLEELDSSLPGKHI